MAQVPDRQLGLGVPVGVRAALAGHVRHAMVDGLFLLARCARTAALIGPSPRPLCCGMSVRPAGAPNDDRVCPTHGAPGPLSADGGGPAAAAAAAPLPADVRAQSALEPAAAGLRGADRRPRQRPQRRRLGHRPGAGRAGAAARQRPVPQDAAREAGVRAHAGRGHPHLRGRELALAAAHRGAAVPPRRSFRAGAGHDQGRRGPGGALAHAAMPAPCTRSTAT